jgi:uncharacterized protein (TIGR03437 family)
MRYGAVARFAGLLVIPYLGPSEISAQTQVKVASAANFRPVVAPGSFASLFGTGLASEVIVASAGSDGQYPRQLGGLTVTVGGAAADLAMVSPNQINFVVPFISQYGVINVVVTDGSQTIATSTVTVSPTAPAVFTTDASGNGFGAILNAIDFTQAPFALKTTTPGGANIDTIVAIYGTGFRFAGAASVSANSGDASSHVLATAASSSGKIWDLSVLYAGPAPGFEGLDQINVQLAPDIDTTSDITLMLSTDAVQANPVYLLLRPPSAPMITSATPAFASPGVSIIVSGNGLIDGRRFQAPAREYALFVLSDGTQIPAPLLNMSGQAIEALVPSAATNSKGDPYYGDTQLCVVVDAMRSCLPNNFSIVKPSPTGVPVGTALMSFAQNTVTQALQALPSQIDPGIRSSVTTTAQAKLDRLRRQISAALSGSPQIIQIADFNGNTVSFLFDVAAIQRVESLLAPGPIDTASPSARGMGNLISDRTDAQATSCGQSEEACLEAAKSAHDQNVNAESAISYTGVGAFVLAAAVGCLADVETACLPGAAAAIAILAPFDEILSVTDYALLGTLVVSELQPFYLDSINGVPSSVTLSPTLPTATFRVQGTALPKYESVPDAVNGIVFDLASTKPCAGGHNRFGLIRYFARPETRPADPADGRLVPIKLQGVCGNLRENAPRTRFASAREHGFLSSDSGGYDRFVRRTGILSTSGVQDKRQ